MVSPASAGTAKKAPAKKAAAPAKKAPPAPKCVPILSKEGRCECESGCGVNTNGLSADVMKVVTDAANEGRKPESCIRTQACQDRLRTCYETRCCQFGRAAKKSSHSDGRACDFNPEKKNPLRVFWDYVTLKNINRLLHEKKHGGGLHVYTSKYVQPGTSIATKPAVKANFKYGSTPAEPPPPNAASRVPASEHQLLANGKYTCPRGLKSICGSTKDTPWCKSWIQSGRTPGCY